MAGERLEILFSPRELHASPKIKSCGAVQVASDQLAYFGHREILVTALEGVS
jgi:hypothetical protein